MEDGESSRSNKRSKSKWLQMVQTIVDQEKGISFTVTLK